MSSLLGTSLASAGLLVVTFFSGIILARVLGPEARGEYGAILMLAQTGAAIGTFSFFEGAIVVIRQKGCDARAMLPTLLPVAVMLTFATACAMLIFFIVDPGMQTVSKLEVYVIAVLVVVANSISAMFSAVERSQMRFKLVNFSRLLAPAIFSALLLGSCFFDPGGLSTLSVLFLFLISKVPFQIFWIAKYLRDLIGWPSLSVAGAALMLGVRLHFAAVLTLLSGQLDRLFGIGLWPKEQLGQYFVAFSVVGAGYSVVTTAMKTVVFPYLSGLSDADRTRQVAGLLKATVLCSIAIVVVGGVVIPVAVPLVYGQAYSKAAHYAFLLLFSMSVVPLQAMIFEAHRSRGRSLASTIMSLAPIIGMLIGFWATSYSDPESLIRAYGLANTLSVAVGIFFLLRSGDIKSSRDLVPGKEELKLVLALLGRR